MEVSTYKANGNYAKELEEELMKFTTAYEDSKVDTHLVQQTEKIHRNVDAEVDIIECAKSGGNKPVEVRQDTTEGSTSFDGSGSEDESADEASSKLCGDASLDFDGFGGMFKRRRRRLTTHWRSFIQPLTWRCKWVELQIKKLQLQAKKYDKKLVEYRQQQKDNQFEKSTVEEDLGAKSFPFSSNLDRQEVFRRKKRKRIETTTDVGQYMSRHNLFSYYENKKPSEGAVMDDTFKNPAKATHQVTFRDDFWVNDESFFLKPGDGDNPLEHILWKIEHLHSQLGKLKSRADNVISENAGKFSWLDDLSLPVPLIGSPQFMTFPPENGDRMPVGTHIASQLMSEYNTGDVLVQEGSTNATRREVDGNERRDLAQFAEELKKGKDILIGNQRVKEEMNDLEGMIVQPVETLMVQKDELGSTAPVVEEPDLPTEDQPLPKIRSISKITAPKGKRKSGRRKAVGRKRRRSTG